MIIKAALIFLGLLALLIIMITWGQFHWHRTTSSVIEQIKPSATRQLKTVDLSEIQDLPEPVQKYFRLALKHGSPIIQSASLTQTGGFRTKPEMTAWSSLQAQQVFSANPPAFVWDASISVMQVVRITVRDSYIKGQGGIQVKFLSLIPLIDAQAARELNEGALQRYLAEAVWFPTALLPSQGVTWRELNPHKASASLTDSGISVTLEFEFNEKGEIISVYTPARYREVSGNYVATPWQGYFSNYVEIDGYLIPSSAAVEWHLADRVYPYWQANLHNVQYIFD